MTTRLIFSKGKNPFSYLIGWITWSDWSHVELVCGEVVYGSNADLGGVSTLLLEDRIAQSKRHAFATTPADPDLVRAAITSQMGKPYDWTDIVGVLMHRDWQDDKKWTCSELIAWAHEQAGTHLIHGKPNRVTPQMLFESALVERE